jgi:hypothetical protein
VGENNFGKQDVTSVVNLGDEPAYRSSRECVKRVVKGVRELYLYITGLKL